MPIEYLEIIVEEYSMEVFLTAWLPNSIGDIPYQIITHTCKDELLIRLPDRLRGYSKFIQPNWSIIVLVDRDDDDCVRLKSDLEQMAASAGLVTRTKAGKVPYAVANRIVIEELEAWFFGDWPAVMRAYPRTSGNIPASSKFRDPDEIAGGTWEALERTLKKAGYFKSGLRKAEAARAIGAHIDPANNRSRSFRHLLAVLSELSS